MLIWAVFLALAICLLYQCEGFAHSREFIKRKAGELEKNPPSTFGVFMLNEPWADTVFYYDLLKLKNTGQYTKENIERLFG